MANLEVIQTPQYSLIDCIEDSSNNKLDKPIVFSNNPVNLLIK
jgi:hypothetical protein